MRRSVTGIFVASLLLSLLLLTAYEAAVTSYYRGENTILTALFNPSPPLARSSFSAEAIFREFNDALLDSPDKASDPAFLAGLGAQAGPLIVALRRNGEIAFSSKPLLPEAVRDLPAFGGLDQSPIEEAEEGGERLFTIRRLDFRAADGETCSFFVLRAPVAHERHLPYPRQLGLIAALLLLAADGAVGVYFTLRITSSLKKLEVEALRMGSGDLATPVATGHSYSELSHVFSVLETMRGEIADLLKREHDRETERRELIANLSHDLRTPLSSIRGYVDGLRDGIADTPEKAKRYLDVTAEKIRLLDRMIGEIFLLSTLEEGEVPPERRRVELGGFVREGIEELEIALPKSDIRLIGPPNRPSPLFIFADPNQLRRVVENIVENARRHGGKKPITVSFTLGREADRAVLRVEDDGLGIPEGELEAAFGRFYRGAAERPGGGTGLGLAIARRIAEANGGRIHAEKAASGGAAIVLSFPLAPEEASP